MSELYVVQQPHSRSNKTDKYRVIRYQDWLNWDEAGDTKAAVPADSEHVNYPDALRACDALNNRIRKAK